MKIVFTVGLGLLFSVALMIVSADLFFEISSQTPWLGSGVYTASKASIESVGFNLLPVFVYSIGCVGLGLLAGVLFMVIAETALLAITAIVVLSGYAASAACEACFRAGRAIVDRVRQRRFKASSFNFVSGKHF